MRFPGCVDGVQKSSFLEKLQENGPGMVAGNFGLSCAQLDGLLKEQVYKAATQASIIPAQYIKVSLCFSWESIIIFLLRCLNELMTT